MHLEERLARQLIALSPHVDGEHVDEIVRPSIFEVAFASPTCCGSTWRRRKSSRSRALTSTRPRPSWRDGRIGCTSVSTPKRSTTAPSFTGAARANPYYETVKGEIPVRYLVDGGYAPMAWDWLVAWRAARIWIGLAGQIERLAGRRIFYEDEAGKPAVDPNTLAVLAAAKGRVGSMIVVEEVHSL